MVPIGQVMSEEKIFVKNNIKNSKKQKKGNNSNMPSQIKMKNRPQIYVMMLNTFIQSQNLAKPKSFEDICEKLLSDQFVLFLVMAAVFLTDQKSPHQFYAEYLVWF